MAADLDYKEDGTAAVVSIGETPWHREGSIHLDRMNPETMILARDLDRVLVMAGLDFEVKKFSTYFDANRQTGEAATQEPEWRRAKGGHAVVRMDRLTAIGSVGDDYTPLQNREAFGPARPLLENGLATIETAGALQGGADVWLLLRLVPSAILKAAEEHVARMGVSITTRIDGLQSYLSEILPFAHFSTHHGGRRAATVQETGVRVVCANTQAQALDGEAEGLRIQIRHTSGVRDAYEGAVGQLMAGLALRYLSMADARTVLRQVVLSGEQFERLVLETAVPVQHLLAKVQKRDGNAHTEAAIRRAHATRDEIATLWTMGKGHTGDRSAWEAYQGLIEYTDHSLSAKSGESRLSSLQTGTLGKVKTRVYADLFAHAAEVLDPA